MAEQLTTTQKAWAQPFQLKEGLSMRAIDVKRLLNLEHVTLNECHLFLNKCKQYRADPFMNDMHMVKYSPTKSASIITGVGFFQKKAAANSRFEGYAPTLWLSDFRAQKPPEWVDFWVPAMHGKYPLACRARCYIKGYKEVQVFTVNWDENFKTKDIWENGKKTGEKKINSTWDGMPSRMLEKDAVVGLLRSCLPEDLAGLYISEEITGDELPVGTVAPASVKLDVPDVTEVAPANTHSHPAEVSATSKPPEEELNKAEPNPTQTEIVEELKEEDTTAPERGTEATDQMPNYNEYDPEKNKDIDKDEIPF